MSEKAHDLTRRERQIMDVIFARGEATAAEVREAIPEPPSYSAVRALLSILEQKGGLQHRVEGGRYIYFPIEARAQASRSAIRRVVKTFFGGSVASTVAALIDPADGKLSAEEFQRIEKILKAAKTK